VSLESAKLALLGTALAIFVFIDGTGGDLGLMHVQTDYPLMESRQFHLSSFSIESGWRLRCGN
jgi:hypothetical protein